MASYHQTIVIGNMGRDPETRYLPSGDAVCNFSVAVTEKYKSKDGEQKESTTWYRINTFGKLAEICGQYLTKGSAVMVAGKMQSRKYEKDGIERESWELRADTMQMLGGKQDGEPRQETEARKPANSKPANSKPSAPSDLDDDIPF
jgi:single-strand DNA-binding protein